VTGNDPWQACKTRSGLPVDQAISALQKEIRRNNVENAAVLAYEIMVSGPELEEYLWFRLKVISVEDIGFGDLMAPVVVNSLDQMRMRIQEGRNDRGLFAIHAVRYLCSRMKDRSSDEMYAWIRKSVANGTLVPHIPVYAIDKHTLEGQRQGKDDGDFYTEGAKVSPELEGRDITYLERILTLLSER